MYSILCISALIHLVLTCEKTQSTNEETIMEFHKSIVNSTTVFLSWEVEEGFSKPQQMYAVTITPYCQSAINTTEKQIVISGLSPSTMYTFEVYRQDGHGSNVMPGGKITVKTWDEEDKNPTNVKAKNITTTSIRLEWDAVQHSTGKPLIYTIVCSPGYGNLMQTNETTYNLVNLAPYIIYEFNVYLTKEDGSFYMPGGYISAETLPKTAKMKDSATLLTPNSKQGPSQPKN
uniref:Receptor-type tyrosine-protein phosphatase eta n=1 Tax=Schistocephalus solidus TaxID=70667 RepID=A0A0X3Q144_SCHSO